MRPGVWWRVAERCVAGAAEAMFPENSLGAPDWREARVVERMIEHLHELPPRPRRMLLFLFGFVELAAPLLVPGLHRFSRLSVARRTRAIRRWRASRLYPFRLVGDGLKMTLTMIYLAHPAVARHMGEYKTCSNPFDPHPVEIRPGALQALP
jgi:hypothetical protein